LARLTAPCPQSYPQIEWAIQKVLSNQKLTEDFAGDSEF
jgi:hypothetical protein